MTAFLCRLTHPLGPMPNEEIDAENLESLEKYRSYTRYLKQAEQAKNSAAWWKTYRSYVEKTDPDYGEKHRTKTFYLVIVETFASSCCQQVVCCCRRRASEHRTALLSTLQDQRGEGEEPGDEGEQEEC